MSNVHGTTQNAPVACEPRMNETISNITNGNLCGLSEACIRLAIVRERIKPVNNNVQELREDFSSMTLIEKVEHQDILINGIHNLISEILGIL